MSAESLYHRHLGDAWELLPEPIRRMHDIGDGLAAEGRAEVVRGRGLPAWAAGWMLSVPAAGRGVPVSVAFRPTPDGEAWRRTFAGKAFESRQSDGRGPWAGLIRESFGPVAIGLECAVRDGRLVLEVRRWTLFGLPMPASLAPYGDAYESAEGGLFRFHVEMRHAWTGLVVRYAGWLAPVEVAESP